jgi:hypothetical protein
MENITANMLSDTKKLDKAILVHAGCAFISVAVSGKLNGSLLDYDRAADPGAIFRAVWAYNGPFELAWISAYNASVWRRYQDSPSDGGFS